MSPFFRSYNFRTFELYRTTIIWYNQFRHHAQISDSHNRFLKNILDSAETVKDEVGDASIIRTPFSPIDLLPTNRDGFFRYEGSLTTPSCDEAVIWTVLTESVPFAVSQIERFKDVKDDKGEALTHNYRTLQRLNSRPLVYVKGTELNGRASGKLASASLIFVVGAGIAAQLLKAIDKMFF